MSTYTFGCDPELFIWDLKSEKFLSSHEFLPGTKRQPFKVENGAVQVDGVAAEFNIDPTTTLEGFKKNIKSVRDQMLEIIQYNGGKNLILKAVPTAKFDKKFFDELPGSTKELGCEPDYCGERRGVNPRPNAGDRPFRTGGGHIHIGWDANAKDPLEAGHFNDCCLLSKALYASGLKLDNLWDSDTERRTLYGSKYSFRPKNFGMEYRYLSNAWVDNPDAMDFIWQVCQNVVKKMDASVKTDYPDQLYTRIPPKLQKPYTDNYVYTSHVERRMDIPSY